MLVTFFVMQKPILNILNFILSKILQGSKIGITNTI